MRFRVTSIQDADLPQSWNKCQPWLEDWLNGSLASDTDIGPDNVCIMLMIFATESLPEVPRPTRLMSNAGGATLALHVVVAPDQILAAAPDEHLSLLCAEILRGLPTRPLRKPKGLDYPRLIQALRACLRPFVSMRHAESRPSS